MAISRHSEKVFPDTGIKPEKEEVRLGGAIFINNTSFSGADIKLVINVYNKEQERQQEVKELEQDNKRDEKELDHHRGVIAKTEKQLETVKRSTPEYEKLSRQRRISQKAAGAIEEGIVDTIQKAKALTQQTSQVSTKVLAECQTISISTHREKMAVRGFGSVYPRGFCRSQREIAGSMIFTVFNEHVLYHFLEADASDFDGLNQYTSAILDQIPPIDITIAFANEYGQIARMALYGVEFVDEGQVMSIEDIMTENTVSFVARDFDPMRAVSKRKINSKGMLMAEQVPLRASDLLLEDDFKKFKEAVSPFTRFRRRRNPFK